MHTSTLVNPVITLWIAASLTFLFYFIAGRNAKLAPAGIQNLAEMIIGFFKDEVASMLGENSSKWLPFILALFTFILIGNLLGLIPGLGAPTSNINVTAGLAIVIFLLTHFMGIMEHGLIKYLRSFIPEGIPLPIVFFLIPIELVSQLARPFSLAVRLFANMFAGHTVAITLITLIFFFKSYLIVPFPIIGNLAVSLFEIFAALIQAYIFTFLATLYISSAIEGEH
ncbi:MAG: F0F1 ATP synthase subunit A [Candidatus Margulisiibacteriota bacterium]